MFVFPMAGLSRRFTEAGYSVPKYMLSAHGKTLFAHAVEGFSAYFEHEAFLFVLRDVMGTAHFVEQQCRELGIKDFQIAILDAPTGGQAETVALGLQQAMTGWDAPITIFNIDTFRPNFQYPEELHFRDGDGYLEVFRGSGANWSYVRPDASRLGVAVETTEKLPISDLCCTGLYYFSSSLKFLDLYARYLKGEMRQPGLNEYYVAPLYNLLMHDGGLVKYNIVRREDVIFCGVPEEYEQFLRSEASTR